MKKIITIASCLVAMVGVKDLHSQNQHELSIHIGVGGNGTYRFESIEGGGGAEGGLSISGGIRYGYSLGNGLKLISGLDYGNHRLTLHSAPLPEEHERDVQIATLSVPLHVQWNIGRWFFIHGGPDIDLQVKEENGMGVQSGIGFTGGIGAQHAFGPWTLSIAPTVKNYALIAFDGERYQRRLITGGASIGLAYRF